MFNIHSTYIIKTYSLVNVVKALWLSRKFCVDIVLGIDCRMSLVHVYVSLQIVIVLHRMYLKLIPAL